MRRFKWSLKTLLAAVLLIALSIACLRNPTSNVNLAASIAVVLVLVLAIPIAIGGRGPWQSASLTFSIVCLLMVYLNEPRRETFNTLPSYRLPLGDWLNEQFGWAEWKGPPDTFVYWSHDTGVWYAAFDQNGAVRSQGVLHPDFAERELGDVIDLDNLPDDIARPSKSNLYDLVTLLGGLWSGLIAGGLAHRVHARRLR